MPRLLKRPEAEYDLEEIWWYIAQDSPHNADKFLDRIQESCLGLANFPHMGTTRDELKAGLRCQPVENYLIFYFPLTAFLISNSYLLSYIVLQSNSHTRWFD